MLLFKAKPWILRSERPSSAIENSDSRHVATTFGCDACGAEMFPKQVGATEMLICGRCGMGRVPDMKPGTDFWLLGEGLDTEVQNHYWTTARSRMFQSALRKLAADDSVGRVLDLGGGIGHFAECALDLGWDAYSLDVSQHAVAAAAARVGAERSLSIQDAAGLTGTCDAVTLWCVIAHVDDPADLIRQALRFLKPGGRILMTTPNFLFQGALARVFARIGRPYDFVCEDHRLHFTPAAIEALLERLDLRSWSFQYFGITENCIMSKRLAPILVPAKRVWNWSGTRTGVFGLQPLCAELQMIGTKPHEPAGWICNDAR